MLLYEQRHPEPDHDDAPLIVLLHGRGASRMDLLPLAGHLPARARVLFPEAPFDAAQWGYGPGSAWYRFLGGNTPEPASFSQSLTALEEFLASCAAERVVLGGFSQGGTMSIGYALAHPSAVTGVLNFSGFLPNHSQVVVQQNTVAGTRFFWGHGRHDTSIPFQLAKEGRAQLHAAGADLVSRDYAIGHWIDPEELSDAIHFLTELLA